METAFFGLQKQKNPSFPIENWGAVRYSYAIASAKGAKSLVHSLPAKTLCETRFRQVS